MAIDLKARLAVFVLTTIAFFCAIATASAIEPIKISRDNVALDLSRAVQIYQNQGENFQVPSYAYTYELTGYPMVEEPYYDRPHKSWIYPTTVERRPLLVGAEGGFLFQNAGGSI